MTRNLSGRVTRLYPVLLLSLILFGFILAGFQQVIANTASDAADQGAYLSIGLAAKEGRSMTDPYRQPLYSWLLTPFAQREMSYFTWAKLFTLGTAACAVLGCYFAARYLTGNTTLALIVALLVASNRYFIQESGVVMVEPLLALIFVLVWLFGLKALEGNRRLDWAVGGVFTGLAYLSKENGLLWLAAWIAGAAVANRLRLKAYNRLLLFALCAVLAASPVFIFNSIQYGAPLRNDNLSSVIWMDDWEQFFAIGPQAQLSMSGYFQTHTLSEIGTRLFTGLLMTGALSISIFMPFPIARGLMGGSGLYIGFLVAIAALFIGLAYVYRKPLLAYLRKKPWSVAFTAAFLIIYALGTAWLAPVTMDPRYIVPLLPMGYILLGGTVLYLGQHTLASRPAWRASIGRGAAILTGLAIILWVGYNWSQLHEADPFEADRQANAAEVKVVGQLGRIAAGTTIVHGPSHNLPVWLVEGPVKVLGAPSNVDWPAFINYLKQQRAQFLVMTPDLYLRREGLFQHLLYPVWPDVEGNDDRVGSIDRALGIRLLPAAWDLLLASQGLPSPYYLFRLSQLPTGRTPLSQGDAWAASGDWGRAREAYLAALAQPNSPQGQLRRALGQIDLIEGRYDDALRQFDDAIKERPDSAWYRVLRGDLLGVLHNGTAALSDYQAALDLGGKEWANVHASAAWAHAQLGDLQAAVEGYREAVRLSPGNPWYEVLLGRALDGAGLPADAIALYQGALDQKLPWPFLYEWLADASRSLGKPVPEVARYLTPEWSETRASYAHGPTLTGYHIENKDYPSDGSLQLALRWIPAPYAGQQYRVYAKLINAVHGVWGEGQEDLHRQGIPDGPWASDAWLQDTMNIEVLPGTPPGVYHLSLSLQDVTQEKWLDTIEGGDVLLGPVELAPRPWSSDQLDMMVSRPAALGEQIRLLGYRLDGEARPGQAVSLTLFWQALGQVETRYTVFTHLSDGLGKLTAQKDNEPADGFYPTTQWRPGEIIRDHYSLPIPADAPPGDYALQVGLYVPQTGQRLPAAGEAASPSGDSVSLATITVK